MRLDIQPTQHQAQVQTLRQYLSPKMIQILSSFQLPYSELAHRIEAAVQDNVFLEVTRYDQLAAPISERRLSSRSDYSSHDDIDPLNHVSREQKSLHQHLREQLRLESLDETEKQIAEAIIDQIDDKGYLRDYDTLRNTLSIRFDVSQRKIGDVLKIIQAFDPDGVGARSLKECLLIQLQQMQLESSELNQLLETVFRDHLETLSKGDLNGLAHELKISTEGASELSSFIRSQFNPNPGLRFSNENPSTPVIPSFEFRVVDGHVKVINLESTYGIQLGLSAEYTQKLTSPQNDLATQQFLQDRYEAAKTWIELLKKRQENMGNIAQFIAKHQHDFVLKGPAFLKPLYQKEIAQFHHISPSTVSRIVSSKYVQTPHGLLPFKALCPRAYFGRSQSLIEAELRDAFSQFPHFSDHKIAEYLLRHRAIKIARRTVNKYRHAILDQQ